GIAAINKKNNSISKNLSRILVAPLLFVLTTALNCLKIYICTRNRDDTFVAAQSTENGDIV
ncbi:MAG: hypothetical protein IIY54_01685, partial [Ruminococcus sp.]|nr:hypothetical protein [Ruminococcus sp.]